MAFGIIQRNETSAAFDFEKIAAAVEKAFQSIWHDHPFAKEEQQNFRTYLRIMAKLGWPAYINRDTVFHSLIIDLFRSYDTAEIEAAIFDYYGPLFLKELEEQLSESDVINKDRLPLFHEAFLLYQLGYYYGAVAILIAQIAGIADDIEKLLKRNNVSYAPETLDLLNNLCKPGSTNDTSRAMRAVLEGKAIDEEENEYIYLLGYLRYRLFDTHMSKEDRERHVNRNLVCHGAQLNYGTKEHALKVILCIDALAWVAEVIAGNITALTDISS